MAIEQTKEVNVRPLDAVVRPSEGIYQVEVLGEREVVDIHMTMTEPWPSKREVLMAHWMSGFPRFPYSVTELIHLGARFKRVA